VKRVISILFIFILFSPTLFAQCALCKAVVASDINSGNSTVIGINNGIIYLMIVPYIVMGVVGYFLYKHFKKNSANYS